MRGRSSFLDFLFPPHVPFPPGFVGRLPLAVKVAESTWSPKLLESGLRICKSTPSSLDMETVCRLVCRW